jgi:hypothetical protein
MLFAMGARNLAIGAGYRVSEVVILRAARHGSTPAAKASKVDILVKISAVVLQFCRHPTIPIKTMLIFQESGLRTHKAQ